MKKAVLIIALLTLPFILIAQSLEDQVQQLNEMFLQKNYTGIQSFSAADTGLSSLEKKRLSAYVSYIKAKAAEKTGDPSAMEIHYLDVLNRETGLNDSQKYLSLITCLSLTEYYMRQGMVVSAVNMLSQLLRLKPLIRLQESDAAATYSISPPSADAVLARANRILSLYFVRLLDAYGKPVILFTVPAGDTYSLDRFPYTSSASALSEKAPPVSSSNTRILYHDGLYRVMTNTYFSREREASLFAEEAMAECVGFDYVLKDMGVHGWMVQIGAFNTLQSAFEKAKQAEDCWTD